MIRAVDTRLDIGDCGHLDNVITATLGAFGRYVIHAGDTTGRNPGPISLFLQSGPALALTRIAPLRHVSALIAHPLKWLLAISTDKNMFDYHPILQSEAGRAGCLPVGPPCPRHRWLKLRLSDRPAGRPV